MLYDTNERTYRLYNDDDHYTLYTKHSNARLTKQSKVYKHDCTGSSEHML